MKKTNMQLLKTKFESKFTNLVIKCCGNNVYELSSRDLLSDDVDFCDTTTVKILTLQDNFNPFIWATYNHVFRRIGDDLLEIFY